MKTCYNCFHELGDTVRICPSCGMGADIFNAAQYPHALPCGSVLAGRYVTGRVLGQGGFGITYVAQNYNTKELAAIKEYYPDSMAIREGSHSVTPYNMDRSSNYEYGKERFLEEAKTLSEFIGNPHIVRVISYFEEHGTAYFVMEYVKGISLKKYLQGKGGKISWQEAMQFLSPVMDALSAVHDKGIIHRDVTPDNIVITDDGNVKLLDFGSARYSIGERSQSLDVILKHGFAPYEQYIRRSRQGSFTDVYSLAATFYYAITGLTPPEAVERIDNDTLQLPSNLGIDIPAGVEAALVKALAVRAGDRIRTMDEFKKALEEGAEPGRSGFVNTEDKGKTGQEDKDRTSPGNIIEITAGAGFADIDRSEQDTGHGDTDKTGYGENVSINTAAQEDNALTEDGSGHKKQEGGTVISGSAEDAASGTSAVDQAAPAEGQDTSPTQNKEIDLTQYAQNKDGQNQEKKLPKWLIPAAAAAAIALIVLFLWGRSGGTGIESGGSGQAAAGSTGTQASSAAEEAADELSPEIRELLSKAEAGDAAAQYELGKAYFSGSGVEQNYEEALAWYTKAAEQGNTDARYGLGEIYHKGDGADKDDEQALKYYRLAAEQGYAPAQAQTGIMLRTGEGSDKNEEEAFTWFQKAADQDDPQGQYWLGKMYLDGTGTKKDEDKAFEWMKKAAEQGLPEAQYETGAMFEEGTGADKSNYDALAGYTKAAKQGYPEAQYALGMCYRQGIGVEKDYEEAFNWFTKAADQGLAKAQSELGYLYEKGAGTDQDYDKAFAWYMKAAEQGYATAQTDVGLCYQYGRGVDKDDEEAVKWFKKAADQGDSYGQNNLGTMYKSGKGVELDYEKALYWYEKSAEQDNPLAMFNLGNTYYNGEGVDQDYEKALEWYRKAADLNNGAAEYKLGMMYFNGEGVPADEDAAFEWFDKAARDGDIDSIRLFAALLFQGVRYVQNYELAFKYYMMAAEAGDPESQYYVALMYENGYGVEQDMEEAMKWYERSAEQGYEEAVNRLNQ